jgi:hypothetical protein
MRIVFGELLIVLGELLMVALLLAGCRKGPREPRFAIELPPAERLAATRVLVDESFGSDSRLPLASLTRAGAGAESLNGWETLELNYTTDGDQVKVTVFALHQEYDPRRHSTIFKSQKLATHTAGVRGAIRLAELEKYGFLPLTLRVVPAK